MEFNIQFSALSILRYATDNITSIGISAIQFLINQIEILPLLIELIEKHPWKLQLQGGMIIIEEC